MVWMRGSLAIAGLAMMAATLAGCSTSSNTAGLNTIQAPQTLRPVQGSTVAQGTLPAIGATGAPAPGLSGQPVLGGVAANPGAYNSLPPIGSNTQTAGTGGFPASTTVGGALGAPAVGGMASGPEGVWTVYAGSSQCRLNLPLTVKDGTSRYRASAPGCALPGLATVSSWQQVGNQVQIFDENNTMVAALAQSGGRYIGTLAGGQGMTMQR